MLWTRFAELSADPPLRNPINGNTGCCARPTTGHAAALPATTMNSLPLHWVAPSAVANKVSGMVRPSDFAVLRLITVSILVDCCTGRLEGFSPLRMRPT